MAKSWASYLTSLQLGFFTCEMGVMMPTSQVVLSTMLTYGRCSVTRNYFPALFPRTCSSSSLTSISPNAFPPIKSSLSFSAVSSHLEACAHHLPLFLLPFLVSNTVMHYLSCFFYSFLLYILLSQFLRTMVKWT